ncbi:MAG: PD-(D/E)XK nuclease family protein [Anaerolineae bacterium]|nr:PD-(D/E)XK nuclease family protein [Anaerolineae bacterium]
MKYSEFLAGSEQLLLSREFKELKERLTFREPNLWQILNISRKETLVSQFLAWLLDPGKEHNFGVQFLKNLVLEALKTDKGRQNRLSPVRFFVMDFPEVEISTESWLQTIGHKKSRCDIIINDRKAGFLCIIENKVGANESSEQTKHYYEHSYSRFLEEQFPHRVYIYLSPYGVPPKNEHFIPLSYQAVLNAIKGLQESGRITETEKFLLRQFQENLQMSIVTDKETLDLAQEIYDTYGPIIDFIYKNAEKPEADSSDTGWDGKSWFFNIGEVGLTPYSWDDSRNYSFICAGGADRYRKIMQKFKPGDVIYAYVSGYGYVGVGTVTKAAVPFRKAMLGDGKTKLLELQQMGMLAGVYDNSLDDDKCEWIVLVKWDRAVDKNQAVRLNPIVPSTASRIYDHRKELIGRVRRGLGIKSTA